MLFIILTHCKNNKKCILISVVHSNVQSVSPTNIRDTETKSCNKLWDSTLVSELLCSNYVFNYFKIDYKLHRIFTESSQYALFNFFFCDFCGCFWVGPSLQTWSFQHFCPEFSAQNPTSHCRHFICVFVVLFLVWLHHIQRVCNATFFPLVHLNFL